MEAKALFVRTQFTVYQAGTMGIPDLIERGETMVKDNERVRLVRSDTHIDGQTLTNDLQEIVEQLANDGFAIKQMVPIISGHYGGNSAAGYGYGYSYTSGILIYAERSL